MKMNATEWETVNSADDSYLDRIAVPGGWLYRMVYWDVGNDEASSLAMVFVADPKAKP